MIKSREIGEPTSCINKAADDEPVFVLRAKDVLAARTVRFWASHAGGTHDDQKIIEAIDLAREMEIWRRKHVR